ncbi:hypothetical protein BVX99_02015 [bacterium F16]|nr:hypothetical protein BVX99_02015 [bacterium F16]
MSFTDHDTSTSYYYNQDERQSVRNLTASDGTTTTTYDYTAYGDKVDSLTSGSVDQRYTYTGRELNEVSGDYYFRYRMYGAGIGGFLSWDPLGFADGMSMYSGYFARWMALDPYGDTLTHTWKKDLIANIIDKYGVNAYTGNHAGNGRAKPYVTWVEIDDIRESKDRKCAWVVWAKPIRVDVLQVYPSDPIKSGWYTKNGEKDLSRHEDNRLWAYKQADEKYLKPNEKTGNVALACGKVYNFVPGYAKQQLQHYLDENRRKAIAQFDKENGVVQKIIYLETESWYPAYRKPKDKIMKPFQRLNYFKPFIPVDCPNKIPWEMPEDY